MSTVTQLRGIARLRRMAGYSQAELADRLGVAQQRVAEWERGTHTPRPAAQRQLAEALGVSTAEVFEAIEASAEPNTRSTEKLYFPDPSAEGHPFRPAA